MHRRRRLPRAFAFAAALLLGASAGGNAGGGGPLGPGRNGGGPAEHRARFSLPRVEAQPGGVVEVPLRVATEDPLALLAWSIEYNPRALELVDVRLERSVEVLLEIPFIDGSFTWTADPEAGWVQAELVIDFFSRVSFSLPPGLAVEVGTLVFRTREDAAPGSYPLTFTRPETATYESTLRDGERAVYNAVRRSDAPFARESRFSGALEPELEDGEVILGIIGDVGIFVRGDANLDLILDVSDPMRILSALFQGGPPLECPRTADANEDGAIDISDPVTILDYLFVGSSDWEPSAVEAKPQDPTSPECSL